MTPGAAVVLLRCPCPDGTSAIRIADAALAAHLAAAATTAPGDSRYRWQGALHRHAEIILTLTTTDACRAALCDLIAALHPYDVPALTWVTVGATDATAARVADACQPGTDPARA